MYGASHKSASGCVCGSTGRTSTVEGDNVGVLSVVEAECYEVSCRVRGARGGGAPIELESATNPPRLIPQTD